MAVNWRGPEAAAKALPDERNSLAAGRAWRRWLDAAGVPGERLLQSPILNHASMLIDAAIEGQGVALARTMLAASDLIAGRLVRPFHAAIPLRNTYWIVCPKVTSGLPKIATFRKWLLAQAASAVRASATPWPSMAASIKTLARFKIRP